MRACRPVGNAGDATGHLRRSGAVTREGGSPCLVPNQIFEWHQVEKSVSRINGLEGPPIRAEGIGKRAVGARSPRPCSRRFEGFQAAPR